MDDVQISMEAAQGLERRLRVQVPAHHIDREMAVRLRSFRQSANLKGFRPGKVPERVIRQRFGDQLRREVLQEVLQSSYAEAVSREKLQPAGAPRVETDTASEGEDLVYTATFEVYPEFQLQGLDSLEIEKPEATIEDADVEAMIATLRRQRAGWVAVDRAAQEQDQVTIDFTGTLDGAPLEGGSAEGARVVLGAGRMLPDFEQALYGARSGESKCFSVRFPPDYHATDLAGKTAEFTAQVHEVAEQALPALDEDFVRGFGVESGTLDDFRASVRQNMRAETESRSRAEVKRQLFDRLLAGNPIEVPSVMVEREARQLQADAMQQIGARDPEQAPGLDSFRQTAEQRVRLGLLVAAVIRDNGISVDRGMVSRRIDEISASYRDPAMMRNLYFQNAELMSQIEHAVLEEQVLDWLVGRASIKVRALAFNDLMALRSAA